MNNYYVLSFCNRSKVDKRFLINQTNIYGLKILDDDLKVEILDILMGFSICTGEENHADSWQGKLRSKLKEDMKYFQELCLLDFRED